VSPAQTLAKSRRRALVRWLVFGVVVLAVVGLPVLALMRCGG